jgi:hypothetical protein
MPVQVVAAVRAWCESSFCWVVRGNHCDAALAARMFLERGGPQNELPAKFSWVPELLPEDVDFMQEIPFSLQIEGYVTLPTAPHWLCHSLFCSCNQTFSNMALCTLELHTCWFISLVYTLPV